MSQMKMYEINTFIMFLHRTSHSLFWFVHGFVQTSLIDPFHKAAWFMNIYKTNLQLRFFWADRVPYIHTVYCSNLS